MKILITGGAGFIGSHVAEKYLQQGEEVYIIDDLSTGSLLNIKHFQAHEDYIKRFFVTIDSILNYEKMRGLVSICDIVIHLAAAVGVQYILDNPLSSIMTNLRGTEMVLELCNKYKKKVLIASTSEVYGKHNHAPLVETDDCVYGPSIKSRWSYAAAKLMDEFTALAYHRTKTLDVIIVRLFNTVGPRQTGRYGMVLPRFVKQALEGEPVKVYGDGNQTRTFTHVFDVVNIICRLMESGKAVGEVINVGGDEEISILELAKKVIRFANSKSEIELIPYDEAYPKDFDDMLRRVPSTEKLMKIAEIVPTIKIDNIVKDVIEYYKESPEIA